MTLPSPAPAPSRKRGAPLGNRNAWRHGAYSAHRQSIDSIISQALNFSPALRASLGDLQAYIPSAKPEPDLTPTPNISIHPAVDLPPRIEPRKETPHPDLPRVEALARSSWQWVALGLYLDTAVPVASAVSSTSELFRAPCKNDLYSMMHAFSMRRGDPFPFLTEDLWQVIAPLVPPFVRPSPRGRPAAEPRLLLDAIFWRLAHLARWQDLPAHYPSQHTCRRYYRRLLSSGAFLAICQALHDRIIGKAGPPLETLVRKGNFIIEGRRVLSAPSLRRCAYTRLALFFLQVANHSCRVQVSRRRRYRRRGSIPVSPRAATPHDVRGGILTLSRVSFFSVPLPKPQKAGRDFVSDVRGFVT